MKTYFAEIPHVQINMGVEFMKKIISILLSLAMLATMCAGLNLTAYAKELNAVSFNIQSNSPQVPDDTVVLAGDISWAMALEDAYEE